MLWPRNTSTRCLPQASLIASTVALESGRVRSPPPISAPQAGESGVTVMSITSSTELSRCCCAAREHPSHHARDDIARLGSGEQQPAVQDEARYAGQSGSLRDQLVGFHFVRTLLAREERLRFVPIHARLLSQIGDHIAVADIASFAEVTAEQRLHNRILEAMLTAEL